MNSRIDSRARIELGGHGAGEVEDDADRDRRVFAGKGGDLLLAVALVDLEVFLFEAGDQAVHGVGDGDRDEHHVDIHADKRAGAGFGSGGPVTAGGCDACGSAGGRSGGGRRRYVDLVEGIVLAEAAPQTEGAKCETKNSEPDPAWLPAHALLILAPIELLSHRRFLRLNAILARLAKGWRHGGVIGLSTRNQ